MGVAAARPHQNVGVAAPRAPLVKFLEVTTVIIEVDLCMKPNFKQHSNRAVFSALLHILH